MMFERLRGRLIEALNDKLASSKPMRPCTGETSVLPNVLTLSSRHRDAVTRK